MEDVLLDIKHLLIMYLVSCVNYIRMGGGGLIGKYYVCVWDFSGSLIIYPYCINADDYLIVMADGLIKLLIVYGIYEFKIHQTLFYCCSINVSQRFIIIYIKIKHITVMLIRQLSYCVCGSSNRPKTRGHANKHCSLRH